MAESHCPLCFTEIQARHVAPCFDCGHAPEELAHLAAGWHTYDEVEVLGTQAIFCDFCQADFLSYDPTYFGRPLGTPIGYDMQRLREVTDPHHSLDKFCPVCDRRLAFLRFVVRARDVAEQLGASEAERGLSGALRAYRRD